MTASLILHSAPLGLAVSALAEKGKADGTSAAREQSQPEADPAKNDFRATLQQQFASEQKQPQQLPTPNGRLQPAPLKPQQQQREQPQLNAQEADGQQQVAPNLETGGTPTPAPALPAPQQSGPEAVAPHIEAEGSVEPAPQPAPASQGGEPALAARITAPAPSASVTPGAVASAVQDAKPDADPKNSHGEDPKHSEPDAPAVTSSMPAQAAQTQQIAGADKLAATEATHASDFEAELAKFRTEPVRGAHVQITGSENQRVDVRMVDQGGTLSLTLRSSDGALNKSLQEHAPELNARLASEHYRAELWTPSAAKTNEARDFTGGNRQTRGDPRETGGNGQGRQNNQGKQQRQQPAWLQDFEDQAKTISNRIEYIWH